MFNWYKCDDTISTDSTCSKCARELDERNNNNKRLIDSFFSRIKALRSFLFDENDEGKDTAQHIFGYSNKKFIFSLILTIITSLFCLYFFLPTDLNELILRSFSIPSTNDVISSKILRTGTIVVCDENVLAQTTCFRDVSYEIEWTKRNSYGSRWRMATIRKATPKCSVIDNVEIEITNYLEKIYTYLFFPKVILTQMVVKTSSNHLKSLMETNGENKRLIQTKSYCRTVV
ncbi:hypothetical protein SNEBB_004213 [Seison nebaliae]|nr:hypothetical protein SNEBB_004213 [Seison nebaliae]